MWYQGAKGQVQPIAFGGQSGVCNAREGETASLTVCINLHCTHMFPCARLGSSPRSTQGGCIPSASHACSLPTWPELLLGSCSRPAGAGARFFGCGARGRSVYLSTTAALVMPLVMPPAELERILLAAHRVFQFQQHARLNLDADDAWLPQCKFHSIASRGGLLGASNASPTVL